jgi:hypothetical protein
LFPALLLPVPVVVAVFLIVASSGLSSTNTKAVSSKFIFLLGSVKVIFRYYL